MSGQTLYVGDDQYQALTAGGDQVAVGRMEALPEGQGDFYSGDVVAVKNACSGKTLDRRIKAVVIHKMSSQVALPIDTPESVRAAARYAMTNGYNYLFVYHLEPVKYTLAEYAADSSRFVDTKATDRLGYYLLALAGEVGEAANVYKKALRKGVALNAAEKDMLLEELGDALWYLTQAAGQVGGINGFERMARDNITKLDRRRATGG